MRSTSPQLPSTHIVPQIALTVHCEQPTYVLHALMVFLTTKSQSQPAICHGRQAAWNCLRAPDHLVTVLKLYSLLSILITCIVCC